MGSSRGDTGITGKVFVFHWHAHVQPRRMFLRYLLVMTGVVFSQFTYMEAAPLPLWPTPAPGALGEKPQDTPSLTAYLPDSDKRNGASMLILPGGGYGGLASHEGKGYADWLVAQGVTCYVLQYRLGS